MNTATQPQQDKNIETYVLGALMLETTRQHYISELKPEYFFNPVHMDIAKALIEMYQERVHIDISTVARYCKDKKYLATPLDIATLVSGVTSSAHMDTHIKYLYQLYGKRKLAEVGAMLQRQATEDGTDPFQIANEVQSEIDAFVNNLSRDPVKIGKMVSREVQRISNRLSEGEALAITTGWSDLDEVCNGMTPGELWILAGRPGMGKTAMAVAVLQAHCRAGGKGLMFSLEMENSALAQRIISGDTGIPAYQLKRGDLQENAIRSMLNYSDTVDGLNIWFEDTPHTTIEKIRSRVKTMKQKHGITCVVCDYLGLVTPTNTKEIREQQVAHISKTAKQIAKECGVTFIMLAQLNREVEKRGDKKPMLSDLRESGAIEQDADLILFPFRPAYYEQGGEVRVKTEEEPAELHIGKNRNGIANIVLQCTFVPGLASYKLRIAETRF
jgi:replicative DNA helicase